MHLDDFDYDLPADRIAHEPVEPRDAARLLVDVEGSVRHRHVADLPSLLGPGDVVVVNDTRVLPARVPIRRAGGGAGEVLLLEPFVDDPGSGWWEALVRPARRLGPGSVAVAERDPDLLFGVGEDLGEGRRLVRPMGADEATIPVGELPARLAVAGEMPLPPYLGGASVDPERYQTVYARRPASAAAPTAGLHLTPRVLDRIVAAGARVERVELVVGLGTFRPIATEDVTHHVMHEEAYVVPPATWEAVRSAQRVVAIGTTSVRALESAAARGELAGRTDLFIHRPYRWQVVDVLLTNFHLPRSSLIVMIDAFIGPRWRTLYQVALDEGYRFLSFGDAMLLTRQGDSACG